MDSITRVLASDYTLDVAAFDAYSLPYQSAGERGRSRSLTVAERFAPPGYALVFFSFFGVVRRSSRV